MAFSALFNLNDVLKGALRLKKILFFIRLYLKSLLKLRDDLFSF